MDRADRAIEFFLIWNLSRYQEHAQLGVCRKVCLACNLQRRRPEISTIFYSKKHPVKFVKYVSLSSSLYKVTGVCPKPFFFFRWSVWCSDPQSAEALQGHPLGSLGFHQSLPSRVSVPKLDGHYTFLRLRGAAWDSNSRPSLRLIA
jgi:hypothetical protein